MKFLPVISLFDVAWSKHKSLLLKINPSMNRRSISNYVGVHIIGTLGVREPPIVSMHPNKGNIKACWRDAGGTTLKRSLSPFTAQTGRAPRLRLRCPSDPCFSGGQTVFFFTFTLTVFLMSATVLISAQNKILLRS